LGPFCSKKRFFLPSKVRVISVAIPTLIRSGFGSRLMHLVSLSSFWQKEILTKEKLPCSKLKDDIVIS
jgi:hypothetical protein